MKRGRLILLLVLLVVPVAVFVAVGGVALWRTGWWWWIWWLLPICWGAAWLLSRGWRDRLEIPQGPENETPRHWTPRDQQALALIEEQQEAVRTVAPEQLAEPQFYFDSARQLGLKMARHYHPKAEDPVSSLTVPDILAVAHLACEDLEEWVHDYVPGSHLLTINHWRALAKAPRWMRTASNFSWAVAVLLNPANVGRFAASKFTMDSASKQVQANVLAWFYVTFVRRVGFYLIEVNSGRLRGGADRYRSMAQRLRAETGRSADLPPDVAKAVLGAAEIAGADPSDTEVTIAVVGQRNAGKSSLINALLGEQRAVSDVLPSTQDVARYQLNLGESHDRLVVLDTPGYGTQGADDQQLRETREAVLNADLVLLVMNAVNPARKPDVAMMESMADGFSQEIRHRPPPVLGVLTHMDLLRPVMEWQPPYDWQNPTSSKEENIRSAVDHLHELFGEHLAGAVPVCTDMTRERVDGIHESLLPAVISLLEDARACSLIRSLHADLDQGHVQKVFRQLCNAGTELLKSYITRV